MGNVSSYVDRGHTAVLVHTYNQGKGTDKSEVCCWLLWMLYLRCPLIHRIDSY